jgi:hypothetical protein
MRLAIPVLLALIGVASALPSGTVSARETPCGACQKKNCYDDEGKKVFLFNECVFARCGLVVR